MKEIYKSILLYNAYAYNEYSSVMKWKFKK